MFGTKLPKINQLQKTIEYKANGQSTSFLNWNMEIESWWGWKLDKVISCSFCVFFFGLS